MIVTIADTYDDLTTLRPYRDPLRLTDALAVMQRSSGSVFDPRTLDRFTAMLGMSPPGMVAHLTTGEIAVVTRPGTEDASRPWVRVVRDADGNTLDGEEINLGERDPDTKEYTRSVLIEVDPTVYGIDPVMHLYGMHPGPRHVSGPPRPEEPQGARTHWLMPVQAPVTAGSGTAEAVALHEPIDAAALAFLREPGNGGDSQFLNEMIDQFLQDAPSKLAALRQALVQADAEVLAREAHGLKGLCSIFGAHLMEAHCNELVARGRAGSVHGADAVLSQLESELSRVRQALEAEKARTPSGSAT
jgi:HPt (histidine-containing phosphotransfer) domain-containing protein